VVGLPVDRAGEVPVASVRRAPGAGVGAEELAAWAGERMAAFKVPERFLFVDDLPRTGTRKVRRDEVRGLFEGEGEAATPPRRRSRSVT
jgi:acyl-coenzyme A synthetase/AMP-(fatty) acid ligase